MVTDVSVASDRCILSSSSLRVLGRFLQRASRVARRGLVLHGEETTLGVRRVATVRALHVDLLGSLLNRACAEFAREALPGLGLGDGGHGESR